MVEAEAVGGDFPPIAAPDSEAEAGKRFTTKALNQAIANQIKTRLHWRNKIKKGEASTKRGFFLIRLPQASKATALSRIILMI